MTMSSDRRQAQYEPLFDMHPSTGASIEVFHADGIAVFGRGGAGWYWWPRRRGFAPDGPATGPFATSYTAYRYALGAALGASSHRIRYFNTISNT